MNRRGFLQAMVGLPVAFTTAEWLSVPELIPSTRSIILPPRYAYSDVFTVTSRHFVSKLIVQIYNTSPVLEQLINQRYNDRLDEMTLRLGHDPAT